ncbi:MAG: PPC domain-containing DNA-binding protein, partial [Candidatus Sungiibacteriota bacterium]
NNKYILRFDRDEELLEALRTFCDAENIAAGFFFCLGAAEKITIAYYNIAKKEYEDKNIDAHLEITSMLGNISTLEGRVAIHSHGNFSDKDMRVYGGHVKKLVVSATCEVILEKFEGKIGRAPDKDIGLNLLK